MESDGEVTSSSEAARREPRPTCLGADSEVCPVDAMVLSGCRICDNLTDEKENN
jgi:hypothetical protein